MAQALTEEGMQELQKNINSLIEEEKKQNEKSDYKLTRRDIRANKELQQLKDKIKLASGEDFDELSAKPITPKEMEDSLVGFAVGMKPTKKDLDAQTSKKYRFNEEGMKERIQSDRADNGKTKSQRKKERSIAFWDRL